MITREDLINKINDYIKELGEELQQDQTIPIRNKLSQVDLLINTNKFLCDYDENVKVLDKYWKDKNRNLKFERSKEEYEK